MTNCQILARIGQTLGDMTSLITDLERRSADQ